jgi:hypothetical protein
MEPQIIRLKGKPSSFCLSSLSLLSLCEEPEYEPQQQGAALFWVSRSWNSMSSDTDGSCHATDVQHTYKYFKQLRQQHFQQFKSYKTRN